VARGGINRVDRLGEQIAREIAIVIDQEVRDPAVSRVTVSGVELARDLSHARVFVTPAADSDVAETLRGLKRAAPFLRHRLGQQMQLRVVPALDFVHDTTLDTANRIEALLNAAPGGPPKEPE